MFYVLPVFCVNLDSAACEGTVSYLKANHIWEFSVTVSFEVHRQNKHTKTSKAMCRLIQVGERRAATGPELKTLRLY